MKDYTNSHLLFYDCLNEFFVILVAMRSIASGEPVNIKIGSSNCGAKRLVEDDGSCGVL